MDVLADIWQWLVEAAAWEWVFSGVGIPIADRLFWRFRRKPPVPQTGGRRHIGVW